MKNPRSDGMRITLKRIAFNLIQIDSNPRPAQAGNIACCAQTGEPD
jgi:hypothetical protein